MGVTLKSRTRLEGFVKPASVPGASDVPAVVPATPPPAMVDTVTELTAMAMARILLLPESL